VVRSLSFARGRPLTLLGGNDRKRR
jgi:hypothetical protein